MGWFDTWRKKDLPDDEVEKRKKALKAQSALAGVTIDDATAEESVRKVMEAEKSPMEKWAEILIPANKIRDFLSAAEKLKKKEQTLLARIMNIAARAASRANAQSEVKAIIGKSLGGVPALLGLPADYRRHMPALCELLTNGALGISQWQFQAKDAPPSRNLVDAIRARPPQPNESHDEHHGPASHKQESDKKEAPAKLTSAKPAATSLAVRRRVVEGRAPEPLQPHSEPAPPGLQTVDVEWEPKPTENENKAELKTAPAIPPPSTTPTAPWLARPRAEVISPPAKSGRVPTAPGFWMPPRQDPTPAAPRPEPTPARGVTAAALEPVTAAHETSESKEPDDKARREITSYLTRKLYIFATNVLFYWVGKTTSCSTDDKFKFFLDTVTDLEYFDTSQKEKYDSFLVYVRYMMKEERRETLLAQLKKHYNIKLENGRWVSTVATPEPAPEEIIDLPKAVRETGPSDAPRTPIAEIKLDRRYIPIPATVEEKRAEAPVSPIAPTGKQPIITEAPENTPPPGSREAQINYYYVLFHDEQKFQDRFAEKLAKPDWFLKHIRDQKDTMIAGLFGPNNENVEAGKNALYYMIEQTISANNTELAIAFAELYPEGNNDLRNENWGVLAKLFLQYATGELTYESTDEQIIQFAQGLHVEDWERLRLQSFLMAARPGPAPQPPQTKPAISVAEPGPILQELPPAPKLATLFPPGGDRREGQRAVAGLIEAAVESKKFAAAIALAKLAPEGDTLVMEANWKALAKSYFTHGYCDWESSDDEIKNIAKRATASDPSAYHRLEGLLMAKRARDKAAVAPWVELARAFAEDNAAKTAEILSAHPALTREAVVLSPLIKKCLANNLGAGEWLDEFLTILPAPKITRVEEPDHEAAQMTEEEAARAARLQRQLYANFFKEPDLLLYKIRWTNDLENMSDAEWNLAREGLFPAKASPDAARAAAALQPVIEAALKQKKILLALRLADLAPSDQPNISNEQWNYLSDKLVDAYSLNQDNYEEELQELLGEIPNSHPEWQHKLYRFVKHAFEDLTPAGGFPLSALEAPAKFLPPKEPTTDTDDKLADFTLEKDEPKLPPPATAAAAVDKFPKPKEEDFIPALDKTYLDKDTREKCLKLLDYFFDPEYEANEYEKFRQLSFSVKANQEIFTDEGAYQFLFAEIARRKPTAAAKEIQEIRSAFLIYLPTSKELETGKDFNPAPQEPVQATPASDTEVRSTLPGADARVPGATAAPEPEINSVRVEQYRAYLIKRDEGKLLTDITDRGFDKPALLMALFPGNKESGAIGGSFSISVLIHMAMNKGNKRIAGELAAVYPPGNEKIRNKNLGTLARAMLDNKDWDDSRYAEIIAILEQMTDKIERELVQDFYDRKIKRQQELAKTGRLLDSKTIRVREDLKRRSDLPEPGTPGADGAPGVGGEPVAGVLPPPETPEQVAMRAEQETRDAVLKLRRSKALAQAIEEGALVRSSKPRRDRIAKREAERLAEAQRAEHELKDNTQLDDETRRVGADEAARKARKDFKELLSNPPALIEKMKSTASMDRDLALAVLFDNQSSDALASGQKSIEGLIDFALKRGESDIARRLCNLPPPSRIFKPVSDALIIYFTKRQVEIAAETKNSWEVRAAVQRLQKQKEGAAWQAAEAIEENSLVKKVPPAIAAERKTIKTPEPTPAVPPPPPDIIPPAPAPAEPNPTPPLDVAGATAVSDGPDIDFSAVMAADNALDVSDDDVDNDDRRRGRKDNKKPSFRGESPKHNDAFARNRPPKRDTGNDKKGDKGKK